MASPMPRTLVVAIDFGTNYTGVSWVLGRPGWAPKEPRIVRGWPSRHHADKENSESPSIVDGTLRC